MVVDLQYISLTYECLVLDSELSTCTSKDIHPSACLQFSLHVNNLVMSTLIDISHAQNKSYVFLDQIRSVSLFLLT